FFLLCVKGVKFIFTNMSPESPEKEYSFVMVMEENTYSLVDCNPWLNGTEELIHELRKSNELFKFVRTMRQKF
ncbi:hypothetical protein M569_15940, partial [Genlisea aurea]